MWLILFIVLCVGVIIVFFTLDGREEKKEKKICKDKLDKVLSYLERQFDGKYYFYINECSGSIRLFSEVEEYYIHTWVTLNVKDISVSLCFSDTYKPIKFTKEQELEEIIGNADFINTEVVANVSVYGTDIDEVYKDPEISLMVADIICKTVLNKPYTKVREEVQEQNKKEQQKRKQKEESILNGVDSDIYY